ncbi:alpha/beta-hydrolase [Ascodesmis nigricans]|uniref:Alpha/beta-hydrolase n=1 Tax=Ascodesmis nigricans TaxID=341454 RepID=A0A4S2MK47_9PEZI|nr:alpha/beta-hydrolase [Ascodesmis nigricans]
MFGPLKALIFATAALAVPLDFGIVFGPGSDNLPVLNLPYASYKAYSYDVSDDYYVFKNIRFAAPPTGERRWKKPEPPAQETGVQDGHTGYQCNQALNALLSFGYPILQNLEPASEDCLFLDIQVPGKAVRGEVKNLPVLFWIFGGGYVLGSKSFFLYDGAPFLKSADNNVIWVAPNYRLGAFGFLNGPTMEKDATPNVAFHDQRAALQWVQDYIHHLGGDKNTVTAMGESAGAGSIMHHLVAKGGTQDPLFKRAIMMSPAFEPRWSPVQAEDQFKQFEKLAGCEGKGLACLRTVPEDILQTANNNITSSAQYGTFGFGPGVDNDYIRDLPNIEMTRGNYWKDVSVIVSHTGNEGYLFANPTIVNDKGANELIDLNFPNATTAARAEMQKLYPSPGLFSRFNTQFARISELIGHWVVNCNVRAIAQAYAGKTWAYTFSIPPGIHGTDLIFAFWRTDLNLYDILQIDLDINFITQKNYATGFQSYLTSFARSGDPNKYRERLGVPPTIDMPLAKVGNQVKVLDMTLTGFKSTDDDDTAKPQCDFWFKDTWTGRS